MSKQTNPSKLETEIKIRIPDRAAFTAKISAVGSRLKTPETLERNLLFDTSDGRLRQRREILRIRKYGDQWMLTHKAPAGSGTAAHKTRVETETKVEDGEALAGIFERLGYRQVFVYEKYRAEWSDGEGHIVMDATPIGDFVELEGDHDWIDRTARKLGIPQSQYLTASYGQLFEDWKKATRHPAKNMTFSEIQG